MSTEITVAAVLGSSPLAGTIAELCRGAGCEVVTDAAAVARAGIMIEAADDDGERRDLLAHAGDVAAPSCLFATTAALESVTELGTAVRDPGRFAALHFFEPAGKVGVVEVVGGERSRAETVTALSAFVRRLGREPVECKDRPGFLINRILLPYLNQALRAFDDGIATGKDIDAAVRLGLGYPVGPLELLDRIGLDVHLDATSAVYEELQDPHYLPPPILKRLVAAGRLGRRTGRGIHDYGEGACR